MLDDQANVVRISQQLQQRTAEREFVERERRRELEEETARMLLDAEEKRRQQRRMLDEQVRSEQEQRAVQLQAQTKRRQDELKMSAQVVQEAQEAAVREAIFRTADALAQQDRLRTQLQDDETRRVQLSQSVELCRLERDAKQRQELQTSAEQRLKDLLENQRREKEKEQQLAALRLDRDFRDIELAAREQLEESTRRIAAMIEVLSARIVLQLTMFPFCIGRGGSPEEDGQQCASAKDCRAQRATGHNQTTSSRGVDVDVSIAKRDEGPTPGPHGSTQGARDRGRAGTPGPAQVH